MPSVIHERPAPLMGICPLPSSYRLKFSKAELATLERACEILEKADECVCEFLGAEGSETLADLGHEELDNLLCTWRVGELLQMIQDQRGSIYIDDCKPEKAATK